MTAGGVRRGLVVGKFWPPHVGHGRVLDAVAAQCDRLFIVVCGVEGQEPSGRERMWWLQSWYPGAEVVLTDDLCAWHHPDSCPPACTELWAHRLDALGISPVEVVGAGEDYGEAFAAALGARLVHLERFEGEVISGTMVRHDLSRYWRSLPGVVRAGLYRRVVMVGAESTGTTTLTVDMARRLGLPSTAEAGRTMSWALLTDAGSMDAVEWDESHFWTLIERQMRFELEAIWNRIDLPPGPLGPWLVCDTDTLATVAWWERYLRRPAGPVHALAHGRLADLYVLTSPDGVAMDESDPLRDGAAIRLSMHERLRELVVDSGREFIEVRGGPGERVAQVVAALEQFERDNQRWVHHTP